MKLQKILMLATFAAIAFTSCKKDDEPAPVPSADIQATVAMTGNQAIADYLAEDANDVMLQVADENNLTGNFTGGPDVSSFVCATVTVSPGAFPKTVTIDFGPLPGCTNNGITRSGKIIVVISDSLRLPQSTATMTFDNYRVNGYKKEGTIIWTNTSVHPAKSWRREVQNGKITAPNGNWWLHNGVKNVTQVAGVATHHNHLDDAFTITGSGNTTNSNGMTRSHEILQPLHKKVICPWIDAGRIRFDGPNHFAILDYGNGACNREAMISIDGQPPHTILLP